MIVSSPLLAAIDKAQITINGAVKSNTCVLENSSPSFELPTVSVSDFKTGGRVGSSDVFLNLKDCGSGASKVMLTASGPASENNEPIIFGNVSTITPVATGLGLVMFKSNGSTSVFRYDGKVTDEVTLTPGVDMMLKFNVRYATTSDTVTAGSFSTIINMKLDYL